MSSFVQRGVVAKDKDKILDVRRKDDESFPRFWKRQKEDGCG